MVSAQSCLRREHGRSLKYHVEQGPVNYPRYQGAAQGKAVGYRSENGTKGVARVAFSWVLIANAMSKLKLIVTMSRKRQNVTQAMR